jgi:tetratricopeptide (TPR) repeat protein
VLPVLADSSLAYGLATILILAVAWFLSRQKRQPRMWFGVLWFFLFLLPSLIRLHDTADFLEHRLYLSFFGFLLVLSELDWIKNLDFTGRATKIIAGTTLSLLFLLTLWHSRNFSDRLTFWRAAATSSPHSALAQRNLGVMYYFMGDVPAAILYYTKALALNPREVMVHNNLGVIYLNQRNWVLAEQEFRAELAVNPNYDKALFNIGDLLMNIGRESEAGVWFEAALKANSYYREAYERLLILNKRLR